MSNTSGWPQFWRDVIIALADAEAERLHEKAARKARRRARRQKIIASARSFPARAGEHRLAIVLGLAIGIPAGYFTGMLVGGLVR